MEHSMMKFHRSALLLAVLLAAPAFAQMDVDQADSLDFHSFHKDKKAAIKVWKDDRKADEKTSDQPVKMYEQQPVAAAPATAAGVSTTAAPSTNAAKAGVEGKRYEIRERYALSRSADTPYSAFYVIEALHQQMASLCPNGWQKLAERSEPVQQDFYLYYELECL
jgi:hypothetical protein